MRKHSSNTVLQLGKGFSRQLRLTNISKGCSIGVKSDRSSKWTGQHFPIDTSAISHQPALRCRCHMTEGKKMKKRHRMMRSASPAFQAQPIDRNSLQPRHMTCFNKACTTCTDNLQCQTRRSTKSIVVQTPCANDSMP